MVCRIYAEGPAFVKGLVWLDLHDIADAKMPYDQVSILPTNAETVVKGAFVYYAARKDDGLDFGAVAQIRITGGEFEDRSRLVLRLDAGRGVSKSIH